VAFANLRYKRIVVDHVFGRRTLHNHTCCATVRASAELAAESIRDEIILSPYTSLDWHLGYLFRHPKP
jgi:hypothetical protein